MINFFKNIFKRFVNLFFGLYSFAIVFPLHRPLVFLATSAQVPSQSDGRTRIRMEGAESWSLFGLQRRFHDFRGRRTVKGDGALITSILINSNR